MSISLSNHETRITTLEKLNSSGWTKGENGYGYWIKESTIGLIIQWGVVNGSSNTRNITFPISHTNTSYFATCIANLNAYPANGDGAPRIMTKNTSSMRANYGPGGNYGSNAPMLWLTIGYLITYSILKYVLREVF